MKTILLGDTHGRPYWKEIVEQSFDKVVFIGDYFDSFDYTGVEQLANFLDIIAFKKANPDKVVMLVGNHDYHYMGMGETYSGFQKGFQWDFAAALKDNYEHLQMCVEINWTKHGGVALASHAGISKTWLVANELSEDDPWLEMAINELFHYKPLKFRFTGSDPYGDSLESSPIWIRPASLAQDGIDRVQIVGHTIIEHIKPPVGDRAKFWMIDTLGTSKEYLVVEDDFFTVKKL